MLIRFALMNNLVTKLSFNKKSCMLLNSNIMIFHWKTLTFNRSKINIQHTNSKKMESFVSYELNVHLRVLISDWKYQTHFFEKMDKMFHV